ncbi:MAG: biotin-dependent carboxyltransferase family protein [Rhodanobacteraceae bacterium]
MSIEVLKPGMLTTIQDRGRLGCAMLGVGRAGPMDDIAMRLANALVGNAIDAAVLEITLAGPRLRFDAPTTIALTGAEFRNVASWRPLGVDAGDVLDIGTARHGARAYLAIAGGLAVDPTLGSVSTDVNAGIGGSPLREGDRIAMRASERATVRDMRWSLDPRPWFDADATHAIRLVRGTHFELLDAASRDALFTQPFRVGKDSNRVGFRLDGPMLALSAPLELVSEPLAIGTLQLPPGGAPIALMTEHPTVGGYPRIGQIAAVDVPRLAQRRPGDVVRFAEIDLDGAQTRYLARERELAKLVEAIGERLQR